MKNGDHNFLVLKSSLDTVVIRADTYVTGPDGTTTFITYQGPRSGSIPVKTYAPGTYKEISWMGESRG